MSVINQVDLVYRVESAGTKKRPLRDRGMLLCIGVRVTSHAETVQQLPAPLFDLRRILQAHAVGGCFFCVVFRRGTNLPRLDSGV